MTDRHDRYAAILALAYPNRMRRLSVEDLEALAELAEDDGMALGEVMRGRA